MWKWVGLCILLSSSLWCYAHGYLADNLADAIQLCCDTGTMQARQSSDGCSSLVMPQDVAPGLTALCSMAGGQCCKEYFQKKEDCDAGINMATSSNRCETSKSPTKVCCDDCKRGAAAGTAGGLDACSAADHAGTKPEELLASAAFEECCKRAANQRHKSDSSNRESVTVTKRAESAVLASVCEDYAPNELCAHHCIPVPGSYRCECNPGFMLMADKRNCREVVKNRCKPRNPCQHKCNDNGVEVKCSCRRGYELMPDGKSCQDIDECLLNLPVCLAGTKCVNVRGSYKCIPLKNKVEGDHRLEKGTCPPGFARNIANNACDDINECQLPHPPCPSYVCENTIGGYKCDGMTGDLNHVDRSGIPQSPVEDRCPPGFKLGAHDDCEDVDECAEQKDDCNPLSQFCINTHNSFYCQDKVSKHCPPGFKIDSATDKCEDINECEEDSEVCRADQVCVNQLGMYDCKQKVDESRHHCPEGFRMKPGKYYCEDVDECVEGTHLCDQYQNCLNTNGSHECHCKLGYELDITTGACIDLNECATGQHNCIQGSQRCDNTVGSYLCIRMTSCGTGYILQHSTGKCEDIDECALGTHNCARAGREYTCVNIPGSFRCVRLRTTTSTTTAAPEYEYVEYYDSEEETDPASTTDKKSTESKTTTEASTTTTTPKPETTSEISKSIPSSTEVVKLIPNNPRADENNEIVPPNYNEPQPSYNESPHTEPTRPESEATQPDTVPDFKPYDPFTPKYSETSRGYEPEPPREEERRLEPPNNEPKPIERQPEYVTMQPEGPIYETVPDEPRTNSSEHEAETKYTIDSEPTRTNDVSPHVVYVNVGTETATVSGDRTADGSVVIDTQDVPKNKWTKIHTKPISCPFGFEVDEYGACFDIDECATNRHSCSGLTEVCRNTMGGYLCDCAHGFRRDIVTSTCVLITTTSSTSTTPAYTTSTTTTAPPPVSSTTKKTYFWGYPEYRTLITRKFRPSNMCDVGFHLNSETGLCDDVDECTNGQENCASEEICVNTQGGYRCECPPNWKLDEYRHRCVPNRNKGQFPTGYGNEPGVRVQDQKEVHSGTKGTHYVDPEIRQIDDGASILKCPRGYRLGDDNSCKDIDECATGQDSCGPMQLCKNLPGGYSCSCPPGHKLIGDHLCEDVDECSLAGAMPICSQNADCINTPGSYQCRCHSGFRSAPVNDKVCVDVDECMESRPSSLCEHRCNNVWGGYRCSCHRGYRLNADNSTCADVDECVEFKSKVPCVGRCVNEPGSYKCTCPSGYRLSDDQRSCIDIDECENGQASCARGISGATSNVCLNTRGSYRCHRIICPSGYKLENKHRCSKVERICQIGDWECAHQPTTISYNFITFVSKLYIPASKVKLFTMRGPSWAHARMRFELKLTDVNVPPSVKDKADIHYFLLTQNNNEAVVSLVRPLEGPQSIELSLSMELHSGDQFGGVAVAKLFIDVSEYGF